MSPLPKCVEPWSPDEEPSCRPLRNYHYAPEYFFQHNFLDKLAAIGDVYLKVVQPHNYKPGMSVLQNKYQRPGIKPYHVDMGFSFYCGHCKTRTSPGMSVGEKNELIDVMCSGCKNIIPASEIVYASGGSSLNTNPIEYKVYRNDHLVVLSFKIIDVTLYGNKLQEHYVQGRITFNAKTGQSYYFQLRENGKRWYNKNNIKAKMMNITYGITYNIVNYGNMPREIFDALGSHIRDIKMEELPYPIPTAREYLGNIVVPKNPIRILASYNRAPNMDFKLFDQLYEDGYRYGSPDHKKLLDKFAKKGRKIKPDSYSAVKEIFEICKIPYKKSLAQIARKRERSILTLHIASRYFEKVDNIARVAAEMPSRFLERGDLHAFLEEFIAQNGETTAAAKLTPKNPDQADLVVDLPLLYQTIIKREPDMVVDLTGNAREIHDRLDIISGMLRKKPVLFDVPEKKIEKLQKEFLGYQFVIAKDSHKLVDIGKDMRICVGGYGDRVSEGRCSIVYVIDKNFDYKACIELDSIERNIVQAKAFANTRPSDDLKEAILMWARDCKLKIDTYDLEIDNQMIA